MLEQNYKLFSEMSKQFCFFSRILVIHKKWGRYSKDGLDNFSKEHGKSFLLISWLFTIRKYMAGR